MAVEVLAVIPYDEARLGVTHMLTQAVAMTATVAGSTLEVKMPQILDQMLKSRRKGSTMTHRGGVVSVG